MESFDVVNVRSPASEEAGSRVPDASGALAAGVPKPHPSTLAPSLGDGAEEPVGVASSDAATSATLPVRVFGAPVMGLTGKWPPRLDACLSFHIATRSRPRWHDRARP